VAQEVVIAPVQTGPDPALLQRQRDAAARAATEQALTFNGVSIENGTPIAFIEDMRNYSVMRVTEGKPLGYGKVGKITLMSMQYIVNNQIKNIPIGFSLAGQALMRSTTTPSQVEINDMIKLVASTQPGDTASPDDLLAQMRLRRLKELGELTLPSDSPTTQPAKPVVQPAEAAPEGGDEAPPPDEN
jgi:hypothetical protein